MNTTIICVISCLQIHTYNCAAVSEFRNQSSFVTEHTHHHVGQSLNCLYRQQLKVWCLCKMSTGAQGDQQHNHHAHKSGFIGCQCRCWTPGAKASVHLWSSWFCFFYPWLFSWDPLVSRHQPHSYAHSVQDSQPPDRVYPDLLVQFDSRPGGSGGKALTQLDKRNLQELSGKGFYALGTREGCVAYAIYWITSVYKVSGSRSCPQALRVFLACYLLVHSYRQSTRLCFSAFSAFCRHHFDLELCSLVFVPVLQQQLVLRQALSDSGLGLKAWSAVVQDSGFVPSFTSCVAPVFSSRPVGTSRQVWIIDTIISDIGSKYSHAISRSPSIKHDLTLRWACGPGPAPWRNQS